MELTTISDGYEPSDEDLKDHWSGKGHLVFRVISYDPNCPYEPYEIDWLDYSGCVGGLNETLGIQYALNNGILNAGKLQLGVTYTLHEITVEWTRGDGWEIDDDMGYYVGDVTKEIVIYQWLYAWWWHFIGHLIHNWRRK